MLAFLDMNNRQLIRLPCPAPESFEDPVWNVFPLVGAFRERRPSPPPRGRASGRLTPRLLVPPEWCVCLVNTLDPKQNSSALFD